MNRRVAVIDIGSNSIKSLVAACTGDGRTLEVLHENTLPVRISTGLSPEHPDLSPEAFVAGVKAVESLVSGCRAYGPLEGTVIVATSAVRRARNGGDFFAAIERRTGIGPRLLSGDEEAEGIARGVLTDPALRHLGGSLSIFDLGGGSLELIRCHQTHLVFRTSLPLGAVRLTEAFLDHAEVPLTPRIVAAMDQHIHTVLTDAAASLTPPLVGCGGGLSAVRSLSTEGAAFIDANALISLETISGLKRQLMELPASARENLPGMPTGRADILPAALLVFEKILALAGTSEVHHSLRNLRFGLAAELLDLAR